MLRPSPNHGTQRLPNDDDDVVVRLEHSHSFIDSLDNDSTALRLTSCRHSRPPGNGSDGDDTIKLFYSNHPKVQWYLMRYMRDTNALNKIRPT